MIVVWVTFQHKICFTTQQLLPAIFSRMRLNVFSVCCKDISCNWFSFTGKREKQLAFRKIRSTRRSYPLFWPWSLYHPHEKYLQAQSSPLSLVTAGGGKKREGLDMDIPTPIQETPPGEFNRNYLKTKQTMTSTSLVGRKYLQFLKRKRKNQLEKTNWG